MNENHQQIIDTGNRMIEQSNRGTQYPLFAIREDIRIWVNSGEDYDELERTEDVNDLWLCEPCYAITENDGELPPECDNCDPDAFDHYRIEKRLAVERVGVFFSEFAAQQHIDENHYHYRNPTVYAIAAWRNPEMVNVMQQIITTTGKDLPSHYA